QLEFSGPALDIPPALSADADGWVWASAGGSLYRASPGKMQALPKHEWVTFVSYRAPDGTDWIGAEPGGLWHVTGPAHAPSREPKQSAKWTRLREDLQRFSGRDWELLGLPDEVAGQEEFLQALTQDRRGGLWGSLGHHGLYRYANGVWAPYGGPKDISTSGVVSEFTDILGRVWFGFTKSQLAVLNGDRLQVFGAGDGLHVGNVTAINGRGAAIWIGGGFGLPHYEAGPFRTIRTSHSDLLRGISGIVETANGDLWLNGFAGIFHIRYAELAHALADPSYNVKGERFGRRDGLPGFAAQVRPLPTVIEATDGRLWFSVSEGV